MTWETKVLFGDTIKMDFRLTRCGVVKYSELTQDRVCCWAFVNVAVNL
jgi:hypothetical protein